MQNEPRQLLERYCSRGDRSAFNTFYRQQADRLWRYLRARGCNEQDAYDFLSEAFLKFIQVVCKDLHSPVALLYRIAINLHIDAHRRHRVSPVIHDEAQVAAAIGEQGKISDEREYVRQLIKKLADSEQNLVLLRYWIGLTHKEIAGVLDVPEGTVRRQCSETMKKLKRYWEDDNE